MNIHNTHIIIHINTIRVFLSIFPIFPSSHAEPRSAHCSDFKSWPLRTKMPPLSDPPTTCRSDLSSGWGQFCRLGFVLLVVVKRMATTVNVFYTVNIHNAYIYIYYLYTTYTTIYLIYYCHSCWSTILTIVVGAFNLLTVPTLTTSALQDEPTSLPLRHGLARWWFFWIIHHSKSIHVYQRVVA